MPATPDDPERVWIEFKKDITNQELRNCLVERYLPLVRLHAERVLARLPETVDLDDLISAGTFGLIDAVNAFDLARGVKFETYCALRIRGAMLDELRAMDWVPRLVRSQTKKLTKAIKTLEVRHGRQPTEVELAAHLEITVAELEKMISDTNTVNLISLNRKWYETDSFKDIYQFDLSRDRKREDPTARLQQEDTWRELLKGLTRQERLLLILYYRDGVTMKVIGQQLGLSAARISHMHSELLVRLKVARAELGRSFGLHGHKAKKTG